jgi:hypothetical protein
MEKCCLCQKTEEERLCHQSGGRRKEIEIQEKEGEPDEFGSRRRRSKLGFRVRPVEGVQHPVC